MWLRYQYITVSHEEIPEKSLKSVPGPILFLVVNILTLFFKFSIINMHVYYVFINDRAYIIWYIFIGFIHVLSFL